MDNYANLKSLGFSVAQLDYLDERDGQKDEKIETSIFNQIIVEYANENPDEVAKNSKLAEWLRSTIGTWEEFSTDVSKKLYNYVKALALPQTDTAVPTDIKTKMTEILTSIANNMKKLEGAPNGNCFATGMVIPDGVEITRIETAYKYTDDSNDMTYYNVISQEGHTVKNSDAAVLKMTYTYEGHMYDIELPVDFVLDTVGLILPYEKISAETFE